MQRNTLPGALPGAAQRLIVPQGGHLALHSGEESDITTVRGESIVNTQFPEPYHPPQGHPVLQLNFRCGLFWRFRLAVTMKALCHHSWGPQGSSSSSSSVLHLTSKLCFVSSQNRGVAVYWALSVLPQSKAVNLPTPKTANKQTNKSS